MVACPDPLGIAAARQRLYIQPYKANGTPMPCEHGQRRSGCKECDGASICEHGRLRSNCKECGGKGICEHGRQRHCCKECGGASICEHGRQKSCCKECKLTQRLANPTHAAAVAWHLDKLEAKNPTPTSR